MNSLARMLMIAGLMLFATGMVIYAANRWSGGGWRLPGDIIVRNKNTTFYFPVVTCLMLSVMLSLLFYLFRRFMK